MSKLITTTIFALTLYHVTAQSTVNNRVLSIENLYYATDTISTQNKYSLTIDINWMDSSIQIRKTTAIRFDLQESRKFRRDSTYNPTPEDTLRYIELRKTFSQNCHSYALEKYFKHVGITNDLFNESTVLTENRYMDKILVTSFEKTKEFKAKRKKCRDCTFEKGTIIVFRNKWNTPIHTVYYDGQFHSKYGGWPAKAENSIDTIIKKYWDTVTIEGYKFDYEKVSRFINRGNKRS